METFEDIETDCSVAAGMTVAIPTCVLDTQNVDEDNLQIGDGSCPAKPELVSHDDHEEIQFKIEKASDCNSEYTNNGTHMSYSWDLKSKSSRKRRSIITRNKSGLDINFSCVIPIESQVDSGEIKVLTGSAEIVLPSALATYQAEIGIYSDDTFTTLRMSSDPINVPDYIFIGLAVESSPVFFAEKCWATPTSDAADESKYEFITNGCPEENEPVLKINSVENGLIGIELESFAFVGEEPSIYLHCIVHICKEGDNDCLPNCSSARRRRSIMSEEGTGTLRVGPIQIGKP